MSGSRVSLSVLPRLGAWFMLAILLLSWAVLLYLHHRLPGSGAIEFDKGKRYISVQTRLPTGQEQGWEAVSLTDDWWESAPQEKQIWYRFELDLVVPSDRLWAIYLPRAAVNASVWLNGELLGGGGRMQEPISINWTRPLYLMIPNGLLKPGSNELTIQLVSDLAGNGLLRAFYLGSDELLSTYYRWRYFIDVTAVEMITIFMVVMSLFMGALWWLRRDSLYGWFSVMVMLWALHHLPLLITTVPLPSGLWWWFWYMTIGWAIICTVYFTHTVLNLNIRWIQRGVFIAGVTGSIILAVAAAIDGYWLRVLGNHVWDTMVLLIGTYSIYKIFTGWHYEQDMDIRWLLMSGLLTFSFGVHDWLVLNSWIARDDGLYIQYSPPLILLVFGWILLMRFVGALTFAEALNRDLEARVQQQVEAVKLQHQQIRELEQQQLLASERERMMRDMHDGLGGHLVSTISLIEGARPTMDDINQALHEALDDLRLVVNSLDPDQGDLSIALSDMRYRLEPRLKAAGIQVKWNSAELPELKQIGPGRVLQILRIIQEGITNIIKHSQCEVMSLEAMVKVSNPHNQLVITIEDNGHGITDSDHNGKGIQNMHKRADRMGATITIKSKPGLTRITLGCPIP